MLQSIKKELDNIKPGTREDVLRQMTAAAKKAAGTNRRKFRVVPWGEMFEDMTVDQILRHSLFDRLKQFENIVLMDYKWNLQHPVVNEDWPVEAVIKWWTKGDPNNKSLLNSWIYRTRWVILDYARKMSTSAYDDDSKLVNVYKADFVQRMYVKYDLPEEIW